MLKSVKNVHLGFSEPSVTSSECFFFWSKQQPEKHKDFIFFIVSDTEKQQNLNIKQLNQQYFLLIY